jgi:CHAD domain-containing protein
VATRRLRSALRTFRDVLEPSWATSLRDALRWLADDLGAVRDAEVLRDRIRSREPLLPESDHRSLEDILDTFEDARVAARERLMQGMRSPRYVSLLDELVAASREPRVLQEIGDERAATALLPTLDGPWKHLKSALDQASEDPSDASLHGARIRAKRARYAAEAVTPVFGKRAAQFAKAAADLQDVLGEHQDSVVARSWLREVAEEGSNAFVAGELSAIEAQVAADARAAWPRVRKAVSRKRLRFWT